MTQNGNRYVHNGVTWQPQANAIVTLYNQAIRVENSGTSGSDGVLALVPASLIEPFTTYVLECDIVEQSAGVIEFGVNAQSNTNDPYRAVTTQSGTGRHSILFTTGATVGTFVALRISARPSTAGLYFVVDNLVLKKYTSVEQTTSYATDFNAAAMSGVNVNDNGQLWKPLTASITSLGVTGGTDKQLQVTCTGVVNDSRVTSEFSTGMAGGDNYLVSFTVSQPEADKRVYLQLQSRSGTGAWTYFNTGLFCTGTGNYQFNFALPAGSDQLKVEFLRQNTGGSWDGLTVPYYLDNFSITRLDTFSTRKVTVCDQPAGGEEEGLYRYGFNGKENDNEVKGEGNQQDYGMRIYDPRLGKFLSVDPLTQEYPWYTPYQFAGNKPIRYIDLDGLEEAEGIFTRFGKYGIQGLFTMSWNDAEATVDHVNRNVNPVGIVAHGTYGTITGKDLVTGQEVGRVDAFTNMGVNGIMLLTGEKLVTAGMTPMLQLETQMAKNAKTLATAETAMAKSEASTAVKSAAASTNKQATKTNSVPVAPSVNATFGPKNQSWWGGEFAVEELRMVEQPLNQVAIQFGKGENQIYHAFRHTDALGLDRSIVQTSIREHFKTVESKIVEGKPFNQVITVEGQKIQYTAFKLSDGTINIGRIHGVK